MYFETNNSKLNSSTILSNKAQYNATKNYEKKSRKSANRRYWNSLT